MYSLISLQQRKSTVTYKQSVAPILTFQGIDLKTFPKACIDVTFVPACTPSPSCGLVPDLTTAPAALPTTSQPPPTYLPRAADNRASSQAAEAAVPLCDRGVQQPSCLGSSSPICSPSGSSVKLCWLPGCWLVRLTPQATLTTDLSPLTWPDLLGTQTVTPMATTSFNFKGQDNNGGFVF